MGIVIRVGGFYLGWRAGSAATTERFKQEDENRINLEIAKQKQQKAIEAQVRYEEAERKRIQKRIEIEERGKK